MDTPVIDAQVHAYERDRPERPWIGFLHGPPEVTDTFGIERCLWGTDWTRGVALLSYAEGVDAFRDTRRLSASDRAALMGGNAVRLYGWQPAR